MASPIETAYAALVEAVGEALVEAGFLSTTEALREDPEGVWEPDGEEGGQVSAAAVFKLRTAPVRPLMGGGVRRWVVDRQVRVELASAGPTPDAGDANEVRLTAALAALAVLPSDDPTLGQTCERCELIEADDDDLPPNGARKTVSFAIRVRAGDPLGQTSPNPPEA